MTLSLPTLADDRVRLRAFTPGDIGLIQAVASDPLIPLITSVPADDSVEQALAFVDRQHSRLESDAGYSFAITDASTDRAVGQIGLWPRAVDAERASIGYWLGSEFRGAGYTSRSLGLLTEWAFTDLGMQRLELAVEPGNEASWHVAERIGFRREGLMRQWQRIGDTRKDLFLYAMLASDLA